MSSASVPGKIGAFTAVVTNFNQSEVRDIRNTILECNIHEDIFSQSMSGNITLVDAQAFEKTFPLVGDEEIQIGLVSSGRDEPQILTNFRVYKMDNQVAVKDRAAFYSLYLASAPMVFDQSQLVTGAYGPSQADDIVRRLFTKYIKPLSSTPLRISEKCVGLHQFIYPRMSALRAISLTTSEAVSELYPQSMLIFYETHEGYYFRSIASLFDQEASETYYWTTQNIQEDATGLHKLGENTFRKHQVIISYSHHKSFDVLRGLTTGQYGMTHQYIDPLMKTYNSKTYTYDKQFKATPHVGDSAYPSLKASSPFLVSAELAHSRYHVTSLSQADSTFISNRMELVEQSNYPRRRTDVIASVHASFVQLQNTSVIIVAVPGYSKLAAGQTVNLVIPDMTGNKRDGADGRHKYLITSLCHRVTDGVYTTILECMRDSRTSPVQNIAPESIGAQLVPITKPSQDDFSGAD